MDATVNEQKSDEMKAVLELIKLLEQSQKQAQAVNVLAMAVYTKQLEEKLDTALQEISSLKSQLEEMNQEYEPESLTQYLKETTGEMKEHYHDMKKQLTEIKAEMNEKAKELVTVVKQEGKQALNRISEFFKIGKKLEKFHDKTKLQIKKVENTIERIDAFENGMRKAGQEAANAMRAIAGKERKEYLEEKVSKMSIVKKPYLEQKEHLEKMLNFTENALEKCNKLSEDVDLQNTKRLKDDEKVVPFKKGKKR